MKAGGEGNASRNWVHLGISSIVAFVVPLVFAAVAFRYASHHGVQSEIDEFIQRGTKIAATGQDYSSFYPPLIPYIVALLIRMGLPHGPFAVAAPAIGLGGVAVLWMCRIVLQREKLAWVGWALVFLNPYLIWNLLVSKDTAYELLFLATAVGAIYKGYLAVKEGDSSIGTWILAGISGALLVLTRSTGLFELLLLLVGFAIALRGRRLIGPVVAAGILLASGLLLGMHNKGSSGTFTLGSNSGINMYFGNHPNYLNGHPLYDIDGFLEPESSAEPAAKITSDGGKDAAYRSKAIEFIKHDKAAFLYRLIAKSEWFWLNLDKVPSLSSNSQITNGETGQARLSKPAVMSNIVYSLYRLPTLFLLIFGTVLALRRMVTRKVLFLYLPMIALWPICALTFPDTRFKLAPESILAPIMVLALQYIVAQYRASRQGRTVHQGSK